MKNLITLIICIACNCHALHAQIITTVAGGGTTGLGDGGPATDCMSHNPESVVKDAAGNLYIADRENNRIRKVNTSGIIITIAGTGTAGYTGNGGPATLATLDGPFAIAISTSGDIFFTETDNNCIRKIDSSGTISTIAGTGTSGYNGDGIQATMAQLNGPGGIAIDNTGNIYVADGGNHRIRRIDVSGAIMTIAGTGMPGYTGDTGPATDAKLNEPSGIAVDAANSIYITEYQNNCIRKIDASGIITTIAGGVASGYSGDNGPATSAKLKQPIGISISASGYIYFADTWNNCIREISPDGIIHTIAGTGILGFYGDGGNATAAQLSHPTGVFIDATNNVYIADWGNNRIRTLRIPAFVKEVSSNSNAIGIYPNPNLGMFTLDIHSSVNEQARAVIYNIIEEKVKEFEATTNTPFSVQLSVPPGMYTLTIIGEGVSASCKINIVN